MAGRKEVSRLDRQSLETTDIFRGAFFLCKGGDLCGIRIKDNGKRIASFMIRGKDLERLDKEYRNGQALVNPVQLRESLNHLRDVMFEKLRQYDQPTPTTAAKVVAVKRLRQARRRTRDDRKGEDRDDQKGC